MRWVEDREALGGFTELPEPFTVWKIIGPVVGFLGLLVTVAIVVIAVTQ